MAMDIYDLQSCCVFELRVENKHMRSFNLVNNITSFEHFLPLLIDWQQIVCKDSASQSTQVGELER